MLLADTALGVSNVKIGDIAIARLVTPFDRGESGPTLRNSDSVRGARSLVAAGQAVSKAQTVNSSAMRFGAIAAGDVAIAWHDTSTVEKLQTGNPRTIAIDRESTAVVSALGERSSFRQAPLFLSNQGIDQVLGNTYKNTAAAAENTATYLMALLEHAWPITPVGQ